MPSHPTLSQKSLHNNEYPMLESLGDSAIGQEWHAGKGERRNITVLFVDLCAYTNLAEVLENDTLFDLIQQFIELLSGVVNRYEGMVDKVLGDGLMALFGAPISYENNAERAVRAAMEMQSSLQMANEQWRSWLPSPLHIHIGIHSGPVILGNIGGNSPLHYTAVGDTVNLARRLQEEATPGEILVSKRVFDSTRAYFEFEPVPNLRLKGLQHSINGFRLLSEKQEPGSPRGLEGFQATMIGRQNELCQVLEVIQDSISHQKGSFILVTGEAGIGKSRLTVEARSRIDPNELDVVEGHSLTYRRSVSYWLFKSALESYLSLTNPSPKSSPKLWLNGVTKDLLVSKAEHVIPYLRELLKLEQSTDSKIPYSSFLEPEQRRQQIFLAVRDFLEAAAHRKPLLVILEDLHWADEASLDLLAFLNTAILRSPLIVYATTRSTNDERSRRTYDQLQKNLQNRYYEIALENLTLDECQTLFTELLASSEFPTMLGRKLLLQTDGNPFFLEEIIRMLMERQILQKHGGRWELNTELTLDEIGVPDNIQDLIQSRFDRLDSTQKKVVQVASLIGRHFNERLLAATLQLGDNFNLGDILSTLIKKSFLNHESNVCDGEFSFQHVLTSDTIYRTLVRGEKEEWYGRIGEALESIHADQLDDHVELLASYYLHSNRKERALHYSILAGKKAFRDYGNELACRYFEQALELFDLAPCSPDKVLEVWLGLGDVAVFTGDYARARNYYQEALRIKDDPQGGLAVRVSSMIKMKIGITYARQGDFELALTTLWDGFNQSARLGNPQDVIEQAQVLNEIGWVHYLKGNVQEARVCLLQGLEIVKSSDRFDVLASIYNRLGAVAYQTRAYPDASDYVRQSLALREKIGDLAGVARLYNNLGLLGLVQGYLREAEENFLKSYEILQKLGDAEGISLTSINVGLMKCERGEFQSAADFLDRGFQAANQIGHRFYIGLARMYMGRLQSMLGEYDLANKALRESIAVFEEIGARDNIVDATIYLGENDLLRDEVDAALDSATLVGTLISVGQGKSALPSVQYGRVIRLKGVIHRHMGEFESASKLIRASAKVFEESNEQLELARSIFELGQLADAGGNSKAAREYFRRARTLFSLLGADLDLSRLNQLNNHSIYPKCI